MAHALAAVPGPAILAMVDPGAAPPAPYPLTPVSTEMPYPKPVYTLPRSWPAYVQLSATLPGAARDPKLQAWVDEELQRRAGPLDQDPGVRTPEGMKPYVWQAEAAERFARTGQAMLSDDPGCLQGDAEIICNRAGRSFRISIEELVRKMSGGTSARGRRWAPDIPTEVQFYRDGVLLKAPIKHAWSSGRKVTYTVTTETGRTLRATDEHPFLTPDGWRRLDELVPGVSRVLVRGSQSTGRDKQPKSVYIEMQSPGHPYARRREVTHYTRRDGSRHPLLTPRVQERQYEHRLVCEATLSGLTLGDFVTKVALGLHTGLVFLDPATHAVHHIDHDHRNNAPGNLRAMTHAEHHRLHAVEGKARSVLYKAVAERVVSVELYGLEDTYDLEIDHPEHNYVANGFVVHNTGKTISAILAILARHGIHGDALPAVIVAPASVCAAWVKAWTAWAPSVAVARYTGPKRGRFLNGSVHADVLVMSYEILTRDATKLRTWLKPKGSEPRGTLVLDEHHLIKNKASARGKAAVGLSPHAACRIVLSGTPITHHPGDLWTALNVLEPLAWPSSERYIARYCETVTEDYQEKIVGLAPAREVEFSVALLGVQRRVAKADALDLPPKVYSVREVPIPPGWRKVYEGMRDKMIAELPEDGSDPMFAMSILTQLTRLQQLAAAPADVWSEMVMDKKLGEEVERQMVKLKGPSWKVEALLEILAERPDQQVLVFSPSRQVIRLAEDALALAQIRFRTLVGGQSAALREDQVQDFQSGGARVMLATTQAGGVGVTLTAASTVVFLGRPFSLVDALQAEDRAHRIGSERHQSIEIIDVLAENTVDQAVRSVLRGKAETLAQVLRDPRVAAEVLGGREVQG